MTDTIGTDTLCSAPSQTNSIRRSRRGTMPMPDPVTLASALRARYWFDTEFIEDGETIELLSIGVVCEDGREFYAVNMDARLERANEWVEANVFPSLREATDDEIKPVGMIADALRQFVTGKPEFWAYYGDYDWVVLCQMFGTMMDLPDGWPMF